MKIQRVLGVLALIITLFSGQAVFAAPLTDAQARSLIGVVQSSPETPASAFTNLITAFSNITVKQAESLITVVQSAPGVKPDAFVDMLLAFTVDSVLPQTSQLEQKIDTLTQKINTLGSAPQPTPNVIIEPMKELVVTVERQVFNVLVDRNTVPEYTNQTYPLGMYYFNVIAKDDLGKAVSDSKGEGDKITISYTGHDSNALGGHQLDERNSLYPNQYGTPFGPYIPTTKGTKVFTFTWGDVVEEVTVEVK